METFVPIIVSILVAFVHNSGQAAGNEFGRKIGGVTFDKAKALFQAVREKFTKKGIDDFEALKNNPDDPDVHGMLSYHIKQCMQSDEAFLKRIADLLPQEDKKGGDRVFETNVNGDVQHLNQFSRVNGIGVVHAGVFVQGGGKPRPEASLEQGIRLLDARNYDQAIQILEQVKSNNPSQADPYYYVAISLLGGGSPYALQHDKAMRIKENLSRACQLDGRHAHYYYFWAIVQFGFFESKGFDGHPDTRQLLIWALNSQVDLGAIRRLIEYLPQMRDNPAYTSMEKALSG